MANSAAADPGPAAPSALGAGPCVVAEADGPAGPDEADGSRPATDSALGGGPGPVAGADTAADSDRASAAGDVRRPAASFGVASMVRAGSSRPRAARSAASAAHAARKGTDWPKNS